MRSPSPPVRLHLPGRRVWTYIKSKVFVLAPNRLQDDLDRLPNFAAMPFTTEEKRKRRAEVAKAEGRVFKALKPARPLDLPPPPCDAPEPPLTKEEQAAETKRCSLQTEFMKASAPLTYFYAMWLHPRQEVKLRPHHVHVLQIQTRDRGITYRAVHQNHIGLWKLEVAAGRHEGKDLWINVPAEALMP